MSCVIWMFEELTIDYWYRGVFHIDVKCTYSRAHLFGGMLWAWDLSLKL